MQQGSSRYRGCQCSSNLHHPPRLRPRLCRAAPNLLESSSGSGSAAAVPAAPTPTGKCWLVGAGPGPADLLTLRAVKALEAAEVVIYDDLGAGEALAHAPAAAERLYVGKRGGRPSIKQPEIDRLIVDKCARGLRVVRLKGGCPSVFSRISSELRALAAAGCEVEIVPGISSGLAAPLLAGAVAYVCGLSWIGALLRAGRRSTPGW